MMMVCTVCGKVAEYNEKLNIHYCREHGFKTWMVEEASEGEEGGLSVNEEIALGGAHLR